MVNKTYKILLFLLISFLYSCDRKYKQANNNFKDGMYYIELIECDGIPPANYGVINKTKYKIDFIYDAPCQLENMILKSSSFIETSKDSIILNIDVRQEHSGSGETYGFDCACFGHHTFVFNNPIDINKKAIIKVINIY